jgi:predicted RNase H-like HicB family nuclease
MKRGKHFLGLYVVPRKLNALKGQIVNSRGVQPRKGPVMHKYEIIIYWSDEDQVFVAEAPELPGCMAHGDTHEAALLNVKEAIQLWLDTAREFGDPVPEPKGRRLMLA